MLLITKEKTRLDMESYDQHLVETRDCDLCNLKDSIEHITHFCTKWKNLQKLWQAKLWIP